MSVGTPEQPNPYTVELALSAALAEIVDAQDADIVKAWAAAWSEVSADLLDILTVILTDVGRVNASAVVRYERLARVLAAIADRLDELAGALAATVTNDLADVLDQAQLGTGELIAAQRVARSVPGSEVPTPALEAIVRRTTEQVTSTALPLADETYALILRELTRGVAAGDNPRQTAARMVERSENLHNFGRSRAVNIARTETLDAYREGARVTQLAHADVLAGWAWIAHLGPRTCRSCLAMHGQVFDLEIPGPDDHPQGRCGRVPVVREEDGTVDLSWIPSAEDHFRGLDRADQIALLGKQGYRAWIAGDFPIESWTKTRHSAEWRDSQVPAAPGDGTGGSGRDGSPDSLGDPDQPGRVLPLDEEISYDGELRSLGTTNPFTADELEALGLLAPEDDPYRHFSDAERDVADWLREHGLEVLSVANANDIGPTPDAVLAASRLTVEFKTLERATAVAIRNGTKSARRQAARVLIDGRNVDLARDIAVNGIVRALGIVGLDLAEIAVILGDDLSVGWRA